MVKDYLPPQRKSTRCDRRVKSKIMTRLRSKTNQLKRVRFQPDTSYMKEKLITRSAARSLFSALSLLDLPNELLSMIMTYFTAKELMLLRCISKKFANLIDNSQSVWSRASYQDVWPSMHNQKFFERGVSAKNHECLVKCGLAHLYHYNLTVGVEKNEKEVTSTASLSAHCLHTLDRSIVPKKPLTWMLIRPPWSTTKSICLKQAVHNQMLKFKSQSRTSDPTVTYNIGRVLNLDTSPGSQEQSIETLELSSEMGCTHATFENLMRQKNTVISDTGSKLKWFRDLYECACQGNMDASFELCKYIAAGESKDFLLHSQSLSLFQKLFSSSKCSRIEKLEQYQQKINGLMRCILVDWLAEVAYMKDMSHQVLHAAVQYVDRFLMTRIVERTKLQLLGITCLLLAAKSHYDPRQVHILTVRESSWLTDQTYQYEDVVKMMGEVIGTFKGDLWSPSSWDYLNLLLTFKEIDSDSQNLAHFLHDMSLQFTIVGGYKSSVLASSILLLARIVLNKDVLWPSVLTEFTGHGVKELANCTAMIYYKCFTCPSIKDDRDLPLKSIKEEYSSAKHNCVAKTLVPLQTEIKSRILAADASLSCTSQEPLVFVVVANEIDETLNMSVKSVDYDGDSEDYNDPASDSSFDEESFCVGRSRLSSLRSVDEFSDDETTMDVDSLNFNPAGRWVHSPRESFTPIFNSTTDRLNLFESKQKDKEARTQDGIFNFPDEACSSSKSEQPFIPVSSSNRSGKHRLKRRHSSLAEEVRAKQHENMVSKRTRSNYAMCK